MNSTSNIQGIEAKNKIESSFYFIVSNIPLEFLKSEVKIQLQNFWKQLAPKCRIFRQLSLKERIIYLLGHE